MEKFYPFKGVGGGTCNQGRISEGGTFKINGYGYIKGCLQMASFILSSRPITTCAAIDTQWQNYRSGVIPNCNGTSYGSFCFQVVGIYSDGTLNVPTNYWRIKMSYGQMYGMNGYVHLYRNFNDMVGTCNLCGGVYTI
jgi:hypothetical protein